MIAAIKKQKVLAAGIFAATAGISLLVLTPAPATQAAPTEADLCSETILAELDVLAEGENPENVPSPSWQEVVADCEALGSGPAYSKNVGPALPLCAWEDGSDSPLPCFWDAKLEGNGRGSSYIVKTAP
jgi:hypothetical protein